MKSAVQETLPLQLNEQRSTSGDRHRDRFDVWQDGPPEDRDPVCTWEFAHHSRQFDHRVRSARRR